MTDDATPQDGPSTLTYLETRLNLMTDNIEKLEKSVDRRFIAHEAATVLVATGVELRFKHVEEMSRAGQDNAKRAVDKAETAQTAHNVASNEWRGTLNDFKSTLVARNEFDKLAADFGAYRLEVSRQISAQSGERAGSKEVKDANVGQLTLIVSAVSAMVTVIVSIALAFFRGSGT